MASKSEKNEQICEHCDWSGKHLLHHLRHNNSCREKTDIEMLKLKVGKEKEERKREYKKVYNRVV